MELARILDTELQRCGLPRAADLIGKRFEFQGQFKRIEDRNEGHILLVTSITGITLEPAEEGSIFPYDIELSLSAKMFSAYEIDHLSCDIVGNRAKFSVWFRRKMGDDHDLDAVDGQLVFLP